eukprot:4279143-Prymnesium_polylepis.1
MPMYRGLVWQPNVAYRHTLQARCRVGWLPRTAKLSEALTARGRPTPPCPSGARGEVRRTRPHRAGALKSRLSPRLSCCDAGTHDSIPPYK